MSEFSRHLSHFVTSFVGENDVIFDVTLLEPLFYPIYWYWSLYFEFKDIYCQLCNAIVLILLECNAMTSLFPFLFDLIMIADNDCCFATFNYRFSFQESRINNF